VEPALSSPSSAEKLRGSCVLDDTRGVRSVESPFKLKGAPRRLVRRSSNSPGGRSGDAGRVGEADCCSRYRVPSAGNCTEARAERPRVRRSSDGDGRWAMGDAGDGRTD